MQILTNSNEFTARLYYLRIFSILAKFQGDKKLIIVMSPTINFLNSSL